MPLTWTPPDAERQEVARVVLSRTEKLTRRRYLDLLEVKFRKAIQAASKEDRNQYLSLPEKWEGLDLTGLEPMQVAEIMVAESEAVAAAVGADPALFPVAPKQMQRVRPEELPEPMDLGDLMTRLYPAME